MESRHVAIHILERIDLTDAFADIVVDNELARTPLQDRDKRFVQELVHGSLRWRGLLRWQAALFYNGDFADCPAPIKHILEISLYQLQFLNRIPAYAAINEGVNLTKKLKGTHWANMVNAILRTFTKKKDELNYPDVSTDPAGHIAIKYSHPQWLVERWVDRYGMEFTEKLCIANNQVSPISLRVNTTKTSKHNLINILKEFGIKTKKAAFLPEFLRAEHLPNLTKFEPFQQGLFTIQDESAGLVTHLIDPQPGETIIDLCAAPGGKTTHLAEKSKNGSRIVAVDRHAGRMALVKENIERLGLSNIRIITADATQFSDTEADKILVDVPCSGLGVLSKRSDLRWRRTLEQIGELVSLQQQILDHAASLLKPKGVIVYSTCTIEPDENELIVEQFLAAHPDFQLDAPSRFFDANIVLNNKYVYTYPHVHQMDGSFAARLTKLG